MWRHAVFVWKQSWRPPAGRVIEPDSTAIGMALETVIERAEYIVVAVCQLPQLVGLCVGKARRQLRIARQDVHLDGIGTQPVADAARTGTGIVSVGIRIKGINHSVARTVHSVF